MASKPYIVDAEGRCQFGRYALPFTSANITDGYLEDYAGWLRQPTRWNAWFRSLRLKEWHFISVNHPDMFVAFAVAQLGYVANLFVYAFDKRTGRMHEWGDRVLLGRSLTFGESSIQGDTVWQSRTCHLKILNRPQGWDIQLSVGQLSANFSMQRDEAMALVFPLAENRAGYTHKEVGNRVQGKLTISGEEFTLTPENCLGASDWSRSFSNRITQWYFACFACLSEEGQRIGLNLSRLIYDDPQGLSQENTLWVDGRSYQTGPAVFTLPDAKDLHSKPWRIQAADWQNPSALSVDLTFEPKGARKEHVSLGFLASKFTQAFGNYAGTVSVNGQSYRIARAFGVAEKHYSKW
ncbi:MAG TPA: DUF2804 domain-containing protein [Oligoflexus sp.]|uniref:DUF2804 domain-containing protein n=1 Tax=Oligoflexus sp. TaxID=1971216 RepID=UPI002D37DB73|nr:DUF2804 domain-containing protein [Oligoflexus sp.]HYX36397.1 DUF2804 domain-containing protein [Oligoflexus sp.]